MAYPVLVWSAQYIKYITVTELERFFCHCNSSVSTKRRQRRELMEAKLNQFLHLSSFGRLTELFITSSAFILLFCQIVFSGSGSKHLNQLVVL